MAKFGSEFAADGESLEPFVIKPSTSEHEIRSTGSLMCEKCGTFCPIIKIQWAFEYYVFVYCVRDDSLEYQSWNMC
jgi:hypothetical protein